MNYKFEYLKFAINILKSFPYHALVKNVYKSSKKESCIQRTKRVG